MKFVVVSDSHGSYQELIDVVNINQDADIFIHLGDYEIPEYLLNRFIFCKGNCDFLSTQKIVLILIMTSVNYILNMEII